MRILRTDDELAIVLAHEITHALNRHGVESLSLRRIIWPVMFIINSVFHLLVMPSLFATVFLSLPYSRKLEYEADEVGLLLCAEACYSPAVAPDVFRRLDELQIDMGGAKTSRLGSMFSTHPHTMERAKKLEKYMAVQMQIFNEESDVLQALPTELNRKTCVTRP